MKTCRCIRFAYSTAVPAEKTGNVWNNVRQLLCVMIPARFPSAYNGSTVLKRKGLVKLTVWDGPKKKSVLNLNAQKVAIQYRKFLLQHTDSYPTQHQWVITLNDRHELPCQPHTPVVSNIWVPPPGAPLELKLECKRTLQQEFPVLYM